MSDRELGYEQAQELRARALAGEKRGKLQAEYGVSSSTFYRIKNGQSYTDPARWGPVPQEVDPAGRTCTRCQKFKSWDNFSPGNPKGLNGRRADCKACVNLAAKDAERKAAREDYRLRYYFRIGLEDYERMLVAQGGKCLLCGRPECAVRQGKVPRMHVDHDRRCCPGSRSCGKCLRGLLCNHCNRALGVIEAIPGFLDEVMVYRDRRVE